MALENLALQVLAYLVTYALHSTLILGLAWLVVRRLDPRSLDLRERIWKLAVAGGFLTAFGQMALGAGPLPGRFTLRPARSSAVASLPPSSAPASAPAQPWDWQDSAKYAALESSSAPEANGPEETALLRSENVGSLPLPAAWLLTSARNLAPTLASLSLEPQGPVARGAASTPLERGRPLAALPGAELPGTWTRAAVLTWSFSGVVAALLFALGFLRLRRALEGRTELESGELAERLERLRKRAGLRRRVRLYVAPQIAAPLSMGLLRPAVCVPPRALHELDPEEQEAMLAHELAHVARRDPAWLFALWGIEALFFFQPLNRLARRSLAETFELAADAWAARATGERLALASCLARIATWIVGEPPPRAHRAWTAAMADSLDARAPRSRLGARIERLLEESVAEAGQSARRVELLPAAAVLVTLCLVGPGASAALPSTADEPEESEAPLEEPEAELPTPASEVEAPEPEPDALESALLFAALDEELEGLEAELGALSGELAGTELDPRIVALVGELAERAAGLRARRARLQALLERALGDEAGPGAPEEHETEAWFETEHEKGIVR